MSKTLMNGLSFTASPSRENRPSFDHSRSVGALGNDFRAAPWTARRELTYRRSTARRATMSARRAAMRESRNARSRPPDFGTSPRAAIWSSIIVKQIGEEVFYERSNEVFEYDRCGGGARSVRVDLGNRAGQAARGSSAARGLRARHGQPDSGAERCLQRLRTHLHAR